MIEVSEKESEMLITVTEAAPMLHLSPAMLRRHCQHGKIPAKFMGGMYFVTLGAVRDFGRKERKPGPKPKHDLQKI